MNISVMQENLARGTARGLGEWKRIVNYRQIQLDKLRNVEVALANFFASGVLALGPKLGPVLWQLAPRHRYDRAQLEDFLPFAEDHDILLVTADEGSAGLTRLAGRSLCDAIERV